MRVGNGYRTHSMKQAYSYIRGVIFNFKLTIEVTYLAMPWVTRKNTQYE